MTQRVAVPGGEVPVAWSGPERAARALVVLAHGAGGSIDDPLLVGVAERLAAGHVAVLRSSFLYRALGKKLPDRMPVLEATYRAVLARAREERPGCPLVIGGKSMGGRVASHLAAAGEPVDGLALLSYPLHPPGKPEQLRVAHLARIAVPTLVVQGTRDPFGGPADLAPHLAVLGPRVRVHAIDGGDHDLKVPKAAGRTRAAVLDEVAREVEAWIGALPGAASG